MRIGKLYSKLILESLDLELSYYCFDIDDNLFHMSTCIHMEKNVDGQWEPIDVSTSDFAKFRNNPDYRLLDSSPEKAFSEFRDNGPRGNMAFLEDMKKAISDGDFGPSWDAFKNCLSSGSIFALITARGNEPETYKKAVEYIIDNVLTDDESNSLYNHCLMNVNIFSHGSSDNFERIPRGKISQTKLVQMYLDHCDFHGVSSPSFAKEFGQASASNPEKAKEICLDRFIDKCNKFGDMVGAKKVSIGFSDDDPKNVDHVHKYFKEKSSFERSVGRNLSLSLFKTTDRQIKGGEVTKYSESNTWGLESSVVPFTKWNNMTQRLYPNSADAPTDDYHNQVKNQTGQASDLGKGLGKFAYKRKKKRSVIK